MRKSVRTIHVSTHVGPRALVSQLPRFNTAYCLTLSLFFKEVRDSELFFVLPAM